MFFVCVFFFLLVFHFHNLNLYFILFDATHKTLLLLHVYCPAALALALSLALSVSRALIHITFSSSSSFSIHFFKVLVCFLTRRQSYCLVIPQLDERLSKNIQCVCVCVCFSSSYLFFFTCRCLTVVVGHLDWEECEEHTRCFKLLLLHIFSTLSLSLSNNNSLSHSHSLPTAGILKKKH